MAPSTTRRVIAALAAIGASVTTYAQGQPATPAPATQSVPGSNAPAATKKVVATAQAEAIVPDAANTPLAIRVSDPNLRWGPCPPLFPSGCRVAVLHGDPAKPGADVFFQVPAGYAIPAHSHTSAEHIVLVTGELEVMYQGRSAVVLQTGQYAYGPPKLPHVGKCRSQGPCTLFISFDEPVDAMAFDGKM